MFRYTFNLIGVIKCKTCFMRFPPDPPYFSVRPLPVYQRLLGQTVTLPCVADGDPKPTIVWRKVSQGHHGIVSNKCKLYQFLCTAVLRATIEQ